ncbi:cysteine protease StiP family protein [Lysinibacillus piscis]|nr:cysteine protease StiP family protein [Lysinibacillus sp. KH24]
MKQPDQMGSYVAEDVTFLLRDLSNAALEITNDKREQLIQAGTHYSEMLPVEYQPTTAYMKLFYNTLESHAERVAVAIGVVARQIADRHDVERLVLVSLARAGTPVGILLKRYLYIYHHINIPHYSISIIRGKGIDETAIRYIFAQHPQASIQFIDGWTGKGAITQELLASCNKWNARYEDKLDAALAVLADPGHCATIFGTRTDFLIPSACLNATVSGLVSRTVLNTNLLAADDFHGAKYYVELQDVDVSNFYLNRITAYFEKVQQAVQQHTLEQGTITWQGMQDIQKIQQTFEIHNSHFIKPGIGETTRVLLRRVPWKILINPQYINELQPILLLAKERDIEVEEYVDMAYACCGLIKEL